LFFEPEETLPARALLLGELLLLAGLAGLTRIHRYVDAAAWASGARGARRHDRFPLPFRCIALEGDAERRTSEAAAAWATVATLATLAAITGRVGPSNPLSPKAGHPTSSARLKIASCPAIPSVTCRERAVGQRDRCL
jgi:hypothetical protein